MNANIACELCGGKEFYKEDGYYFCNECQTQTKDIIEQVFDTEREADIPKRTQKVKAKSKKLKQEQITSWECCNYVLLGLVNELIELGADPQLKTTVKFLWFTYLEKLEVINQTGKPKLQAVNSAIDAEIIYGRSRKRKRTRKLPSTSGSSDSDVKSARIKTRKAMVMADYDEYTRLSSTMDTSMTNQSLQSLKGSTTNKYQIQTKYLHYNKSAKKALLKNMTKSHLHKHRKDIHSELNCHKMTHRKVGSGYVFGPFVLKRSNLYAILYLGLLLNKDKIQLGDMLRFIREGHLSYNQVAHFIPEEKSEARLNMKAFEKKNPLTSKGLRRIAAKMAVYLKLTGNAVPVQNLPALVQRYCRELNLPNEIANHALRHMSLSRPFMKMGLKPTLIPNYEARAISFIIFVLKLLFGLDGETEYFFTDLSRKINHVHGNIRMFEWESWAKFLKYRHIVLCKYHLPTQFLYDNASVDPSLYTNFMQQHYEDVEGKDVKVEFDVLKNLLEKLQRLQTHDSNDVLFNFIPSLTPFWDHTQMILRMNEMKKFFYLSPLLKEDFTQTSIDFLFYPGHYLKDIHTKKVRLLHGGANENLSTLQLRNLKTMYYQNYSDVTVKVVEQEKSCSEPTCSKPIDLEVDFKQLDTEKVLKKFEGSNASSFKSNFKKMNMFLKERFPDEDATEVFLTDEQMHKKRKCYYNPEERYWLLMENMSNLACHDFKMLTDKLPVSFKLVLSECARIIEQHEIDLYNEFCNLELYMCYAANYKGHKKRVEQLPKLDRSLILDKMLSRAKSLW